MEKVDQQNTIYRQLSFGIGHIFKDLQLEKPNGHISREELLEKELSLAEDSLKNYSNI